MSSKTHIDNSVVERLSAFLSSELFTIKSTITKSEYWKYHGRLLQTKVWGRETVEISGDSSFYVPTSASLLYRTTRRGLRGMKSPKKIIPWLYSQFTSRFGVPRLMSYAQSFNAVMNGADILSSFQINHVNLSKLEGVLSGSESVQSYYQA